MHTAFSRQSEKKVYVQDKMTQNALTVRSLLLDHGGYFYICGDARMARQVQATLCRILDENTAGTNTGEAFVQTLKSTGHYQVFLSSPIMISDLPD
jgi:Sulfite reductase, alpha subunit (flavoprotein)